MTLRRSARIQVNSQSIQPPEGDNNGVLTTAPAKKRNSSGSAQLNGETQDGINPSKAPARRSRTSKPAVPKSTTSPNDQNGEDFALPELPKTPLPKRRRTAATANLPPMTPTPSAVALISSPANRSSPPVPDHHARPAGPHATNAPLQTPGGTRLTAYSEDDHVLESPVKGGVRLPRPTTTTESLLEEAKAHLLRVDTTGRLKAVVEKYPCRIFSPEGLMEEVDPFRSLTSGIIAQQVSGAAASSIKNKFIALFPDCAGFPTPSQVAAADLSFLRTAGLSGRKAEYIQGLAQKFASGELSASMLLSASDDEVMEKLTAVRGLGRWSVEMFACFGLKRMDVFSTGDLGVQRGMAAWMGRDVGRLKAKGGGKWKYMSEKEMVELSEVFRPYRSLFMWYMWRIEDVNVDAVQNA